MELLVGKSGKGGGKSLHLVGGAALGPGVHRLRGGADCCSAARSWWATETLLSRYAGSVDKKDLFGDPAAGTKVSQDNSRAR